MGSLDLIEAVALVLTFLFVFVSVAAVATEEAFRLVSQNRSDIDDSGQPKRERSLRRLRSDPRAASTFLRLLAMVSQTGQTTTVALLAVRWLSWPWILVVLAINICLVFVLAEAVPRTLAILNPQRWALLMAGPVILLLRLWPVRPVVRGLIGLANMIVPGRGLGMGPFSPAEELIALADAAVEESVLEKDERDLIQSAIKFRDTIVREVMVPRPDMLAVDQSVSVGSALETSSSAGYSRLPALGAVTDEVTGLVYVKDLIRAELDGKAAESVEQLLRPAHHVPETKRVSELLREMQEQKFHMAIAIDEYGGVAGLVTLEDLIEELVGEIVDEYDVEEPLVELQPDGTLRVDGRIAIDELNELAGLALPEGDWDTVAGLVFDRFGRVPKTGESCNVDGYRLRVERLQGRRITRVLVVKANV